MAHHPRLGEDYQGPKPFRLFSPYLAGFARRPCQLVTTDLFVKNTAHKRPEVA
jgi:hypothetical protein